MRQSFLAVLILMATIGSAAAQPAEVVVRYGDLNLNDERDAAILLERIGRAADQVCVRRHSALYELDDSLIRWELRHCRADSIAHAVDGVGALMLKRLLAQAE